MHRLVPGLKGTVFSTSGLFFLCLRLCKAARHSSPSMCFWMWPSGGAREGSGPKVGSPLSSGAQSLGRIASELGS